MTGRRVTGALYVDCGEGREIRGGDRAGQIRWTRQPRARYECVACGYQSEIVTGAEAVRAFVATIRTTHQHNAAQGAA